MLAAVGASLESGEPAVVHGAVDQRGGHVLVAEHASPAGELDVRGVDHAPGLVGIRYDLEQEPRTLLVDRHVAELVDDQEPRLGDLPELRVEPVLALRAAQPHEQPGRGEEPDRYRAHAREPAQRDREMGLAGADGPIEHEVLATVDEVERLELRAPPVGGHAQIRGQPPVHDGRIPRVDQRPARMPRAKGLGRVIPVVGVPGHGRARYAEFPRYLPVAQALAVELPDTPSDTHRCRHFLSSREPSVWLTGTRESTKEPHDAGVPIPPAPSPPTPSKLNAQGVQEQVPTVNTFIRSHTRPRRLRVVVRRPAAPLHSRIPESEGIHRTETRPLRNHPTHRCQSKLIELRRRNRQLEMEVDVLKQAALIFARR